MSAAILAAWLLALPPLLGGYTTGAPIPRRPRVAIVIAEVAMTRADPKWWAAVLDVWAAHETGYADADAAGGCPGVPVGTFCKRSDRAESCGPWMVECGRLPHRATLHDEGELAIAMFEWSMRGCPAHPFGLYATGKCRSLRIVDLRLEEVRRELAVDAAIEGVP